MPRLLVSNIAWLIDFGPDPAAPPVVSRDLDLLIENGRIAAVGPRLSAPEGTEVLDASERIVLPGFVDAHRHLWLTALRALTADSDLGAYLELVLGRLAPRYTPEDVYASTYFGALECLDAGVTTVQDFAHIIYTPEHADAAVAALTDARIRAVFGYGYPAMDAAARDLADVRRVREQHFSGVSNPLLTMALSPAGPSYAPLETVREDWKLARELGIPLTVHVGAGPVADRPMAALQREGLLTPGTVYVHGNSLPDDELAIIADSGGAVAIAPAVEAQMGHGAPMIGRLRAAGVGVGLGADVVTATAGDMFTLMRAVLVTGQLVTGHVGDGARPTTADVLRAATLGGAEVLGLADRTGSLRPGKRADLVLLRADAANLVPLHHDPVGAVVSSAHPGNVDTVLVEGRVVKRCGSIVGDVSARHALVSSADRIVGVAGKRLA